jgi:hypothetical protein
MGEEPITREREDEGKRYSKYMSPLFVIQALGLLSD